MSEHQISRQGPWPRFSGQDDEVALSNISAEINAELEHHLDLLADECRREGVQEEDLDTIVRQRFGNTDDVRRDCLRQRTGAIHVKQKLHQIITVILALSVIGLILTQRQAQVSAAMELEVLHSTVAHLMQRLDSSDVATESPLAQIGDRVQIIAFPEELQGTFMVDVGGALLLPEIGRVHVAGLTAEEIQQMVFKKATQFWVSADVQIAIHRDPSGLAEALTEGF